MYLFSIAALSKCLFVESLPDDCRKISMTISKTYFSPCRRSRSRSPGDRRLSSYDRYREGENGSFRRRRSGSRDRRRRPSPLPPPPPVPLSPYRRNSPPYEHHYTPYLPSGEIGTFGGRFHQSYGDRSHSRSRMPDRRRRH